MDLQELIIDYLEKKLKDQTNFNYATFDKYGMVTMWKKEPEFVRGEWDEDDLEAEDIEEVDLKKCIVSWEF
jgi:hypothetical protein